MSDMQAFGSWRIILLEDASLGNPDDVLTRVGANGAEFKPGGGGGASAWGDITGTLANQADLQAALDAVTFDQSLNEADDVVFASVEVTDVLRLPGSGAGGFSTLQSAIQTKADFGISARNASDDGNYAIFTLTGDSLELGQGTAAGVSLFRSAAHTYNLLSIENGDDSWQVGLAAGAFAPHFSTDPVSLGSSDVPWTTSVINEITTPTGIALNLAPDGALNINGTPGVTAGPFTTITNITVTKGIVTDLQGT